MSILIGFPDVAFVTDASGQFSLAPGVPVTELPAEQRLAVGLLSDADSVFAPLLVAYLSPAAVADTETVYAAGVAPGSVTLAPAIYTDPETFYPPQASAGAITLAAPLVTDSDTTFAADVAASGALLTLLPPIVVDVDSTFRPLLDVVAPPLHGSTQHLRCGLVTDSDTIYAAGVVGARLQPGLVSDADTIFAIPSVAASNSIRPATVPADDAVPAPGVTNIRLGLQPATVVDVETMFPFGTTLFLAPALVADADAIPASDVGWQLAPEFLAEDDQHFDVAVETRTGIYPDVYIETEHLENYEFRVQNVSGGISAPPPIGVLKGSLNRPRKLLSGSLGPGRRLTGSIKRKGKILTGSLRRGLR